MNTLVTDVRAVSWPMRPLRYLAEINSEALPETHPADADIEYVDIGAVGQGMWSAPPESLTFGAAPSRARRIVRDGDILVSTVRTYLRAVVRIEDPSPNLVASTGFAVLRPSTDVVDSRFLYYWCLSDHFIESVVAKSMGVSYPAINATDLLALPVAAPPLDTQGRIAGMLDAETARIDTLIEKNKRLRDLAGLRSRALRDSITRPRLGECGTPLRFIMQEVDERVGEATTDLPLLSVSILSGVGRRRTDNHGQTAGEDLSNYKICHAEDVVLNRMRAFQGAVGVAPEKGVISSDYAVLRLLRGEPRFYHHLMRSDWFVAEMTRRLRGIGGPSSSSVRTPRVNVADLGRITIPSRSVEDQRAISLRLDQDAKKLKRLYEAVDRQQELLRLRRQALITAAVTGEIEV